MKSARVVLAAALSMLAAGSGSAFAQAKDPAMDKLAADWAATFAKGDAKALAGFYTDNAVRVTPDSGTVVGKAAIEKEFAAAFAGPWKGAKIVIKVGSIQQATPDLAVNEGTYEVTGTGPDGKPIVQKGAYLNTVMKKGGAWIIASNAAVLPSAPPK